MSCCKLESSSTVTRGRGDFLSLEVLNTPFIGPNLRLAEEADPGDGRLDVVRIGPGARKEIGEHLRSLLKREVDDPRSVDRNQGETIEATWTGLPLHIDGDVEAVDEGEEITTGWLMYGASGIVVGRR